MAGDRLSCLNEMVAEKLAEIRAAKAAGVPFRPAARRPAHGLKFGEVQRHG